MFCKFDGFQDHKFTIVFLLSWTACTVLYTLPHNSIGVPSSVHTVVTCGQGRAVVRLRDARSQHPAPGSVKGRTLYCLLSPRNSVHSLYYTLYNMCFTALNHNITDFEFSKKKNTMSTKNVLLYQYNLIQFVKNCTVHFSEVRIKAVSL